MGRDTQDIFLVIAFGYLSWLVFKWSLLLAGWAVPFWANGVALLVLTYQGFRLAKKSP